MTTKDDALKLALEALTRDGWQKAGDAIRAIREALAHAPTVREQPAPVAEPHEQQEPVAWEDEQGNVRMTLDAGEIQSSVGYVYSVNGERIKNACIRSDIPNGTPLYTSPPNVPTARASKPWVGLTKEERVDFTLGCGSYETVCAIEAKLREKNS